MQIGTGSRNGFSIASKDRCTGVRIVDLPEFRFTGQGEVVITHVTLVLKTILAFKTEVFHSLMVKFLN